MSAQRLRHGNIGVAKLFGKPQLFQTVTAEKSASADDFQRIIRLEFFHRRAIKGVIADGAHALAQLHPFQRRKAFKGIRRHAGHAVPDDEGFCPVHAGGIVGRTIFSTQTGVHIALAVDGQGGGLCVELPCQIGADRAGECPAVGLRRESVRRLRCIRRLCAVVMHGKQRKRRNNAHGQYRSHADAEYLRYLLLHVFSFALW